MDDKIEARACRVSAFPMEEYDAFVAGHPDATPYHHSGWLKAAERAYSHTGWLVTVHRESELSGVLPLVKIERPVGPGTFVSLPFCDLGGPLVDDEEVRQRLLAEARALADNNRVRGLEVRESGDSLEESNAESGTESSKVRMLCPLPENSDLLFKSYKPKLRSQIRKAEKNGLSSEVRTDKAAVDLFYQVFTQNMLRLGSPVHSRHWFYELKQAYGEQMLVGLVFLGDQPVGAGIVLLAGNQACIPWASTLERYNRLAPNMLLYWALLSHVCDLGCSVFDFGRSTMGEGTYRFKKQWGARPYELIWNQWEINGNSESEPVRDQKRRNLASHIRPIAEGIWRRLPLSLANWIGPKLRRYITL